MNTLADLDQAIENLRGRIADEPNFAIDLVNQLIDGSSLNQELADVNIRVAALLRIAAVDDQLLYMNRNRRQIIELIEGRLRETNSSVLKWYNIGTGGQADEVCRSLARIVQDASTGLQDAIELYEGVRNVERFRTGLLRALNEDRAKATLRPFVSADGSGTQSLQRSLGAVVDYTTSTPDDARSALDNALNTIRMAIRGLSGSGTAVARLLAGVLEKLEADLRIHFDMSPLSKPAEILLNTALRRHPLHVSDLELSIPIELQNESEGVAFDLEIELTEAIGIKAMDTSVRVSSMPPGSMIVEFRAQSDPDSMVDMECAACVFRLHWMNSDGSIIDEEITAELHSQDPDLDWEGLSFTNPYSLEAVETEDELIGRSGVLGEMARVLATARVGSLYIYGQKRVGKTSLAHVALQVASKQRDVKCIYLEVGEINNPDPATATNNLARELIAELNSHFQLWPDLASFEFDGSLSPLIRALKILARSGRTVIIAIDEFDRLPATLYRRNAEGDAFFTALRSIATLKGIGLVLIGGERMKLIINNMGVELNKFKSLPVDYLDRATHWPEFEEFVRKPTEGFLEFTEAACSKIYDATAGNPYYTKLLCDKILELATARRDAYIDGREVDSATTALLNAIDSTSFSHYWEDHVLEDDVARDEVTLRRRRCLLALGLAWNSREHVTTGDVARESRALGLTAETTETELNEFSDRGFLVDSSSGWRPRVELFGRWLRERGQREIVITAAELRSVETLISERESLNISITEADELADRFGPFRGKSYSGERILAYLRQFGGHREQRLILQFLQGIQVVTQQDEYLLLNSAYQGLQQKLKLRHGEWNINQVALSHTGRIEKSGVAVVRTFIKANASSIGSKRVYGPSELTRLPDKGITDVVVLDDFIGSGSTLVRELGELRNTLPESVCVHVLVLAAMRRGFDSVANAAAEKFGTQQSVECMLELEHDEGPFDVNAGFYADEVDARDARTLIEDFGVKLEPKIPMGYGGCCAPIVFSRTIPNNAPPILWSSSRGSFEFTPLFPRHG